MSDKVSGCCLLPIQTGHRISSSNKATIYKLKDLIYTDKPTKKNNMKKTIITTLATTVLALGAFAQGSLTSIQSVFFNDGVTTPGANASNPASATTYYTGNANLELFYAATANVTAGQITTINALDGTPGGGAAALSLLSLDGFSLVSATQLTNSTAGSLSFAVSGGNFTAADPNTIGLLSPVPTGGSGWIAMYLVGAGGTFNNYSGVLAFSQSNLGGNPTTTPAGTPFSIVRDPAGLNLVLTTAVPEPSTMALAGLGGLAAFLFRRKK
jgi:PEP-CTERM motif